MFQDVRGVALSYDPAADIARLVVGGGGTTVRRVGGQLLLDAQGFLVGIDLGGEGFERTVVMLGPHEKVDRTVPADVEVAYDAGGQPAEVRIAGARGAVRGGEKNPYVGVGTRS